ncbi:5'-nucleotidase C-terminal domain-containing protein [Pseudogracilibacillus auburnensis]|uniref:5'-nucleotidase C-terminal domain-containing protein n=1 Tax=Pseudogracilibacillus auburnensis TaxID=1494959 RepID=UPI0027DA63B2|nr:5'-nucleotidase C-terminal domain-containing protein [Pseudogracilibacillus auburnensis]
MKNRIFRNTIVKTMLALLLIFSVLPAHTLAEVESQTDEPVETNELAERDGEAVGDEDESIESVNKEEDSTEEDDSETEQKEQLEDVSKTKEVEKTTSEHETDQGNDQVHEQEAQKEEDDDAGEEATTEDESLNVTIMHMNDTHAHLDPMPNMLSAIKEVRANKDNTLLLHGGDVFSGTLYFNTFKGQADLALMNLMGFDAMVYGNHEFDLGSGEGGHKSLAEFVKGANFPLLGTNVDFSADPYMAGLVYSNKLVENASGGKSYHSIVKEVDGEKIGIFGLTTEDTAAISSPVGVKFLDYYTTAVDAVKTFEDAGIDKIIAVTHLGYDSNPAVGNDLALAQIDGIDVIVGGHTHTALQNPVVIKKDRQGQEKDPTVIVQAGQYAGNLGTLDVTFDEEGVVSDYSGELLSVSNYPADPNASKILKTYSDEIENIKNEPSGAVALKDLPNPRLGEDSNESVRANETELGNLITDAMLAKAKEKFPDTVIALQNGGGIRAPIAKGEITVGEIISVIPFGNDPVIVTVTGAELKEILEHSVRLAPKENGGFLHVSGMKFTYDSSKEPGDRVLDMEVKQGDKFVAIESDTEYLITTNQFTAQGGDGFETFQKAYQEGRVTNIGEIDWEQLRDYMVNEKYLNGEVDPVREGRITDVESFGSNVTIMHMNDTHAHLDTMPQMFTAIKEVREDHADSLLLHGGDVFSGTLYFNEFKGKADVTLMNLMDFDAMVFGNHEFDLGSNEGGHKSLSEFVKSANFPLLGSNVDFTADPYMTELVHPEKLVEDASGGKSYHSIVKEVDGEKIGIFGLTTEDTAAISSPVGVEFLNYYTTAVDAVKMFEDAGINRIIALTHLGYDSNPAVGNDLTLAQIDGIDVIVGGHTHTKLSKPVVITENSKGQDKDPTVIVQAGQYTENLGKLDVWFDDEGIITHHEGELIDVTKKEADPEASEVLAPFSDEIDSIKNEKSGAVALKDLLNPRLGEDSDDSVRANETELGNLVTDAMLAKAQEKFPETVIALQNGGGIRAPIMEGPITVGEIIAVLPFGNDPVVANVTGTELKEILEHSVRLAPGENGGFLHVSGMRFIYDSSKEEGNRVLKMEVKQDDKYVEIKQDEEYLITTNQFTAQGGDGFETFAKIYEEGRVKNIGEIDWEQLKDYMVEEKYLDGKVDPVREGRILDAARDEIPGEEPKDPDPKPGEDPDPKPGDNTDKPGDNTDKPGDDTGKQDEDKNGTKVTIDEHDGKGGSKLPSTATTIYTTLLVGGLLLLIGVAIFIYRRYKLN